MKHIISLLDYIFVKKGKLIKGKIGRLYPPHYKRVEDIDLSPIFLIGGNRTGTSLTASLFAQHPDIEGIFNKSIKSIPVNKDTGHTNNYCSSHHVWNFLDDYEKGWEKKDEGVLWGHPKHISKNYMDKSRNTKEKLSLANSINYYRKTDKIPLINSHFNMFRIGLITEVFPNAKFILTVRDFEDYILSCIHKWSKQKIHIDLPKIGIHWLTLNSTCIYDLNKYSPNNYDIVEYSSLFLSKKAVNEMLNNKLKTIGLKPFKFDLSMINTKYRFSDDKPYSTATIHDLFAYIKNLLSYEKGISN